VRTRARNASIGLAEHMTPQQRIAAKKPVAAPLHANPALDGLVVRAVQLHRASRLPEAEALYRDVLVIDPRHAEALHLLGVIAHQSGHHAAAAELIEQAISEKPRESDFHSNLGLVYQSLKRVDDAIRHFKRALAISPKLASAASHLGTTLLLAGRTEDAINAAAAALAIAETQEAKTLLAQCLRVPHDVTRIAPARGMILRALAERWHRPDALARTVSRLVSQTGALTKTVTRANAAWPRLLPAAELDLPRAQSDRLLQALLVSTSISVPELERYVSNIRAVLLSQCLTSASDVSALPLACALAQQCFINEYVFCVSEGEAAQLRDLRETVSAGLVAGRPISPLQLAILAAYAPLSTLAAAQKLLAMDWPEPLKTS
jgi:Flp pilus assembly protein TadD